MKCIAFLYFLYLSATINCSSRNEKKDELDCGLYYWSHVQDLVTTCVISNRDMENDKDNFNQIQEKILLTLTNQEKDTLEALMINFTKNTVFPRQIGNFPSLENLRIQNTDLKKLDFNGRSNITFLFLGHNELSQIDQNAFNGLLNLKLLYLNNNKLSKIHNKTFKRLTNLQVIWLNDNHLKEISSEMFSGNVNLQRIKLQFNEIKFIENNAFNLQGPNKKLKNLNLRGNICIDIETFILNITEVVTNIKSNCSSSKILKILESS